LLSEAIGYYEPQMRPFWLFLWSENWHQYYSQLFMILESIT